MVRGNVVENEKKIVIMNDIAYFHYINILSIFYVVSRYSQTFTKYLIILLCFARYLLSLFKYFEMA